MSDPITRAVDVEELAKALEREGEEPPGQRAGIHVLMGRAASTLRSQHQQIERMRERVAGLEAFQEKYALHPLGCNSISRGGDCTCGLDAARAALSPTEEQQ